MSGKKKKKIIVIGVAMVALLFILSLADKIFLYPAMIGFMVLMHMGMHGMHGKHKEDD